MSTFRRDFRDLDELLTLAESPIDEKRSGAKGRVSLNAAPSESWTLGATLGDAIKLARNGWSEGRKLADAWRGKFAELIAPEIERRETTEPAITGDYCDAGLYATGAPECMIAFVTEEREGLGPSEKIVEIGIDCAAFSNITADQIMARGGAMLALIDAIEAHGIRTEVIARECVRSSYDDYQITCPIKSADQPMDADKLAMIAAHPATLRRILFSINEHEPIKVRNSIGFLSGDGYGTPRRSLEESAIQMPAIFDERGLKSWLIAQLRILGVIAPEDTDKA